MSRNLGRDVPASEKLYAKELGLIFRSLICDGTYFEFKGESASVVKGFLKIPASLSPIDISSGSMALYLYLDVNCPRHYCLSVILWGGRCCSLRNPTTGVHASNTMSL